jgi:capsular exopolysaccharide synthesis family protein
MTLTTLLDQILSGKWWVLAVFMTAVLAAALYTAFQVPQYQATSMVHVESQGAAIGSLTMTGLEEASTIGTQVEIIRSRTIAQQVVERLEVLGRNPLTGEPFQLVRDRPEGSTYDPVETLRKRRLNVAPLGREVSLINITVQSPVPEEATLIANLYADEYQQYDQEVSRLSSANLRRFFDRQVREIDSTLRVEEGDFIDYLNRQSVVAPKTEATVLVQQIQALQQQVYQSEAQRRGAQAVLEGIEAEVDRLSPNVAVQLRNSDVAVIAELQRNLAIEQANLERFYTINPDQRATQTPSEEVARARRNIAAFQKRIDELSERLAENVVGGVPVIGGGNAAMGGSGVAERLSDLVRQQVEARIELSAAEASLDVLYGGVREARNRIDELPLQDLNQERYLRSIDQWQESLLEYQRQQQIAQASEQAEIGDVRVVDYAIVPRSPVSPRPGLNLVLAGTLGLIAGLGLILLIGALDSKVRRPDHIRDRGFTVLGVIPSMQRTVQQDFGGASTVTIEDHTYSSTLLTLLNPLSPIAESFRRLRTSIEYSRPDNPPRIIQVTSPGPGEGKSTTAANIAIAMAQAGRKTLYLDADLRRPSAHRLMGEPREPGLVEYLFGDEGAVGTRLRTAIDNLDLLPTGRLTSNPGELLGSQKMKDALANFLESYDLIIVDTPPLLAVNDPALISTLADYIIVVASADETTTADLERAVDVLASVNRAVDGVVLNRFDAQRAYGYSYGSKGYGYGAYQYGETL